jgi:hypothetical protein
MLFTLNPYLCSVLHYHYQAAAVPVVAQRNSFSDLGGDDSD